MGKLRELRQAKPVPDEVLAWMRWFIDCMPWVFAKTYAHTHPHEYVFVIWRGESDSRMLQFARHLVAYGYEARWKDKYITAYIEIDGYKYWIMGYKYWIMDRPDQVNLINRQPLAGYTPGEVEAALAELERKKQMRKQ